MDVLRKNWRPVLAFTIVLILLSQFVFLPVLIIFTKSAFVLQILPSEFWVFATAVMSIYIASRGAEKIKNAEEGETLDEVSIPGTKD